MAIDFGWYADRGIDDYDEIKELEAFGALLASPDLLSEPETDDPRTLGEELWGREMDRAFEDSTLTDRYLRFMEADDE